MTKKVHILTRDGKPLFNRLFDDGSLVLYFQSGYGWVDRLDIARFGWLLRDGWTDDPDETLNS